MTTRIVQVLSFSRSLLGVVGVVAEVARLARDPDEVEELERPAVGLEASGPAGLRLLVPARDRHRRVRRRPSRQTYGFGCLPDLKSVEGLTTTERSKRKSELTRSPMKRLPGLGVNGIGRISTLCSLLTEVFRPLPKRKTLPAAADREEPAARVADEVELRLPAPEDRVERVLVGERADVGQDAGEVGLADRGEVEPVASRCSPCRPA